jgi:hypothetical protein
LSAIYGGEGPFGAEAQDSRNGDRHEEGPHARADAPLVSTNAVKGNE